MKFWKFWLKTTWVEWYNQYPYTHTHTYAKLSYRTMPMFLRKNFTRFRKSLIWNVCPVYDDKIRVPIDKCYKWWNSKFNRFQLELVLRLKDWYVRSEYKCRLLCAFICVCVVCAFFIVIFRSIPVIPQIIIFAFIVHSKQWMELMSRECDE